MTVGIKGWLHWAAGYGISRASLKLLARQGDPLAQLVIDTSQPDNVYRLAEQVRLRGPLSAVPGGGLITGDASVVRQILRDDRFRTVKPPDRSTLRIGRWILARTDPGVLNAVEPPSMLVTDPPDHARLRRLVSRAFTPRALDGLRQRIQDVADDLLDHLDEDASCDLVADYTSRIPIEVIAEMLGIPRDETTYLDSFGDRGTRLIATLGPSWREFKMSIAAMTEFEQYLAMHIERLRRRGADDSILASVLRDGDLSETEVRMFAALLLGAGFITTAHVLGKAVATLLRHPEQLDGLRADPELWPNAVEELLRYETAIQWSGRFATETLEIQGHTVLAGQGVLLLLGAANRDPAFFERPDDFDFTRTNAREHLSFGTGIHVCLGAALARMELQIGLRSLFERFPRLTLVGEPTLNDSMGVHGLKHLPVRLGPTAMAAS